MMTVGHLPRSNASSSLMGLTWSLGGIVACRLASRAALLLMAGTGKRMH